MFADTNIIHLGYFGIRQNNWDFAIMFTWPVLRVYYVARRPAPMKKTIFCGLLFLLLHFSQAFAQQADGFEWEEDDLQEVTITGYTESNTTVIIPKYINAMPVTGIYHNVFANKGLASIDIPDSVTFIGSYAFANNRLTGIDLPDALDFNGAGMFANNRLASVTIPNGVRSIESGAFANNQLTSIDIPDSVNRIQAAAFANNRLTSITIPNGMGEIGHGAFAGNPLISITIGEGVDLRWEVLGNNDSFDRAYIDGGRLAGTYTRPNPESNVWTRED